MRSILAAVLLVSSLALADVPPPNSQGCTSKNAGDSCNTDSHAAGTCASRTCSKLDYSDGSPPSTIQVPCLLCEASDGGASSGSGGGTGGGSGTGGSSSSSKGGGCGAVPASLALSLVPALLFLRRRLTA